MDRILVALCDSGSTTTMTNTTNLPYGVVPSQGPPKRKTTTNGTFNMSENVIIYNIKLPEFANTSIEDMQTSPL